MKTLIYGAGPIGQWLALRLDQAGLDGTLPAILAGIATPARDQLIESVRHFETGIDEREVA